MAATLNTPETEDGAGNSLFNPKSPHFFKIIIDGMGQSQKITIPRKFIRKYAVDLAKSEFTILKVPTGAVWRVGLNTGEDGAVWLENGWSDFMKFYSIKLGDFLVFCYKTVSLNEFDVVVFDRSATEIEYPLKDRATPSWVMVEEVSDNNDDGETYAGLASSSRTNRGKRHVLSGNNSTEKIIVNSKTLKGPEKLKALGRAKHFKSSKPYFPVVMQPYYLHPPYKLNVPARFLERCVDRKQSGELKLCVDGGKFWTVEYHITWAEKVGAKFIQGWKEFVIDNGLVLGDVCIFELIRGLGSVSFKVTIFRAPRTVASSPVLSQDTKVQVGTLMREGCSGTNSSSRLEQDRKCKQKILSPSRTGPADHLTKSKSSVFHLVMTRSSLSESRPELPKSFVRDHLNIEIKKQMVSLKVQDRSWPARLMISSPSLNSHRARLGFGFKTFAKENFLRIGDVCTFELTQKVEIIFRVSISRAKKEPKDLVS